MLPSAVLLVHWSPLVGCECETIREQWRAMEDIYATKQARAIGVSNYCRERRAPPPPSIFFSI